MEKKHISLDNVLDTAKEEVLMEDGIKQVTAFDDSILDTMEGFEGKEDIDSTYDKPFKKLF